MGFGVNRSGGENAYVGATAGTEKRATIQTGADKKVGQLREQFQQSTAATLEQNAAIKPGKLQTTFHETAKMRTWENTAREKYKECGKKHGGTTELNVGGHVYVVPKDPGRVVSAYKEQKAKISAQIKVEETKQYSYD